MKSFLQRLLVAVCALYLSGAHWGMLQVTAWTGMLLTRAHQSDVAEAVKTTFDGAHPCTLCEAITAGQSAERQQAPEWPVVKKVVELNGLVAEIAEMPRPRASGEVSWSEYRNVGDWRTDAPPTPPPLG